MFDLDLAFDGYALFLYVMSLSLLQKFLVIR